MDGQLTEDNADSLPSTASVSTSLPPTWLSEVKERRAEAVRGAVRSFAISRESLTGGRFSDSERLIRFFEGVAMSLQREPTDDEVAETERVFRAVLRYRSSTENTDNAKEQQDTAGREAEEELLALQAQHNLAVVIHRRYLRLRHNQPEATELPEAMKLKECAESAMWEYQEVIRAANRPKFVQQALENDEKSIVRRKAAVFLAASVGALNLAITGEMQVPDAGDVSIDPPPGTPTPPLPGTLSPFEANPSAATSQPPKPSQFLAFAKQVAEWAEKVEAETRKAATLKPKPPEEKKKFRWASLMWEVVKAIYSVVSVNRTGEQPLIAAAIVRELERLEPAIRLLDGTQGSSK